MRQEYHHYVGQYCDNKRDGKGTCYWNNGSWYEGEWKQDKMEGEGTYVAYENSK